MIDVPPPPAQHCVSVSSPEAHSGRMLLVIGGDPAQVDALRSDASQHPIWRIEADASSNGVRFLRLAAPLDVSYREIGELVFQAQRRQLAVAFQAVPPICELQGR